MQDADIAASRKTLAFTYKAIRWAGFRRQMLKFAKKHGLGCTLSSRTGFLFETGRCTVTGPLRTIEILQDGLAEMGVDARVLEVPQ